MEQRIPTSWKNGRQRERWHSSKYKLENEGGISEVIQQPEESLDGPASPVHLITARRSRNAGLAALQNWEICSRSPSGRKDLPRRAWWHLGQDMWHLTGQVKGPPWCHHALHVLIPPQSSSTCQGCWKPLPQRNHVDSDGCKSQGTKLMNPVLLDNHDISIIGLEHLHNLGTSCYLHGDICLHEFTSHLHPNEAAASPADHHGLLAAPPQGASPAGRDDLKPTNSKIFPPQGAPHTGCTSLFPLPGQEQHPQPQHWGHRG